MIIFILRMWEKEKKERVLRVRESKMRYVPHTKRKKEKSIKCKNDWARWSSPTRVRTKKLVPDWEGNNVSLLVIEEDCNTRTMWCCYAMVAIWGLFYIFGLIVVVFGNQIIFFFNLYIVFFCRLFGMAELGYYIMARWMLLKHYGSISSSSADSSLWQS